MPGKLKTILNAFPLKQASSLDEYHAVGFALQSVASAEGRKGIANVVVRLTITEPGTFGSPVFARYSVSVTASLNVVPSVVSQPAVQLPVSHAHELITTATFLSLRLPGASWI